ncbi:MAG: helix-turn-helix domain-containing protein [Planctomycetes bacterium]|nr:helix-turn-helix domain-containing protein [Planctomycetota bacterium]
MGYMTIAEAAQKLRVSIATIRRRIRAGRLRAYRNGRLLRIRESDLVALAEARQAYGWGDLSADSFAADWDNPYDAVYDDWRRRESRKR